MSTVTQSPAPRHASAPAPKTWRFPWASAIACLVILAGTLVFLYPHVASWFSQKEQSRVTALAQETMELPPNDNEIYRSEQIELAREYNNALASGAVYEANANIATGDGSSSDETLVYSELLNINDAGFMGRLRYDALDIDLPIYHGTSDEVLNKGVGHLEGTSLPVGGVGSRSVLTAHRGLPRATLFNELDKAAIGDTFTLSVMGEVLTYQVVESQVIEPSETHAILADPDRDLVTLVTCTPLGINTHRILVTAERITPTPIADIEAAQAVPTLPGFPWWAVVLAAVVIGIGLYIWRSGYVPAPKKKAEAEVPATE
ncbi:sortase A [Ruaniaceae bacterium KH17]|nr:sortase A [Ruaniaceae bacterium KH17]